MNQKYRAGIYIRLSREDEKEEKNVDSESVKNQRNLLMNYIKEHDYFFYKEYVDDGYSGSNFDRPAFQALITDIENKKINMVIVKDLSRLGRNNIETNEYIERYFPKHSIRFIAILDDVDTEIDTYGNEMAPFKVFVNSYYNKETSKKIKTTLKNKKKGGLFTGWKAPYGYQKDPSNPYHLIIDKKVEPVVKKIFELAKNGNSSTKIASILSKRKIPNPSNYANLNQTSLNSWCPRTIDDMLTNQTYIGNLTQGRRKKIYGMKLEIRTKQEDWIIVHNTHEAIIDLKTFEAVQKVKQHITKKSTNNYLFSGFLICKECGHSLSIIKNKNRKQVYTSCNYYRKHSKLHVCTPHTMNYKQLESKILTTLNNLLITNIDKNKLIHKLQYLDHKHNSCCNLCKNLNQEKNKLIVLENQQDQLYLDFKQNLISLQQYIRLKKEIEEKNMIQQKIIQQLKDKIKKNKTTLEYEKIIDQYLSLKKMQKVFFSNLIDRIEIDKNKNVDIYFRFHI